MKILFSADHHILLGQKGVPQDFQKNRHTLLAEALNQIFKENDCDEHIIGGDILDKFAPTTDEVELYFEFTSKLDHKTKIYSGNHEMVSKTKSVLDKLAKETTRGNSLVTVVSSERNEEYDIVDYRELHIKEWKPNKSKLCFTHVRGEIPPHVTSEIDLDKFSKYSLVVSGDLHSHKCTQKSKSGIPIVYPGSPLTTSFHSERQKGGNGCLIIDTETLTYTWHDLSHLPQLIRKTINAGEDLIEDVYDRVVYKVVGDLSQLKQLTDSDLLDKKVHINIGTDATLNLQKDGKISHELILWMKQVEKMDSTNIKAVTSLFKTLINEEEYS